MKKQRIFWFIAILLIITSQVMADNDIVSNEKQSAYEAIREFTNLSDINIQSVGQLSTQSGMFEIYNSDTSLFYVNSELNMGKVSFYPPNSIRI
ncbi:MAG: hypothetical protein GYA34_11695 [Chloroflexi bacterium]|nr:hypothetical protein [Chloroflexota bacterium]